TRVDHFFRLTAGEPHDFGSVVVLFDAGLNGLPVAQHTLPAVPVHQRCRDDGFADAGVGARYEEAPDHDRLSPSPTLAPTRAASARVKESIASSVSVTFTHTRSRAVPGATLGGLMARTSKPCS